MEEKRKIEELWRYLKIQDDEAMIIFRHNHAKGSDECAVVESEGGHLCMCVHENVEHAIKSLNKFRIVQYRDVYGKYATPSVLDLVKDELEDY